MSETERGKVANLQKVRGFGFIADANGDGIFFHARQTEAFESMERGDDVEFRRTIGREGKPQAVDVRRVYIST